MYVLTVMWSANVIAFVAIPSARELLFASVVSLSMETVAALSLELITITAPICVLLALSTINVVLYIMYLTSEKCLHVVDHRPPSQRGKGSLPPHHPINVPILMLYPVHTYCRSLPAIFHEIWF